VADYRTNHPQHRGAVLLHDGLKRRLDVLIDLHP